MSQTDKHLYNSGPARTNGVGNTFTSTKTIHQAKVVEILEGHRVRARVDGLDNRIKDADLTICHPMMPLFMKINPVIGEVVDVMLCDIAQPYEDRRWFGPNITQYQYLDGLPYLATSVGVNRDGLYKQHEQENPRTRENAQGLFSNETDSSEQVWNSRGTTDITQKKNQVRIRSGKSKKAKPLEKNTQNPATLVVHTSEDGTNSAVAAVADKIFLLGHNGNPIFPQTRNGEITDELLKAMEENSHPATLSKYLVEFLDLFRQAFMLHAHGYDGATLLKTAVVKKLEEFDLSQVYSKTVHTN